MHYRLSGCYDGTLSNESITDARRLIRDMDQTPQADALVAVMAYGPEVVGDWLEDRGYHRDAVRHVVAH